MLEFKNRAEVGNNSVENIQPEQENNGGPVPNRKLRKYLSQTEYFYYHLHLHHEETHHIFLSQRLLIQNCQDALAINQGKE